MATKTYFINFLLIVFSLPLFAQNNEKLLEEWTKKNETRLVNKYPLVDSKWFEPQCLDLARTMQFDKINQCKLFDSQHINAYVFNSGHVYFSTALIQLINNKHQWASILAHENAHIELNHYLKNLRLIKKPPIFFPKAKIKKQMRRYEQQADVWAEKKLLTYDFDPSQINFFLNRVRSIKGNNKSNTHLKLSKRSTTIKKVEIKDINLMQLIMSINQ